MVWCNFKKGCVVKGEKYDKRYLWQIRKIGRDLFSIFFAFSLDNLWSHKKVKPSSHQKTFYPVNLQRLMVSPTNIIYSESDKYSAMQNVRQ